MEISSSTIFFLGMDGGWEHKWSRTDKCLISIAYFTSFLFNIISVMSTVFFFSFLPIQVENEVRRHILK